MSQINPTTQKKELSDLKSAFSSNDSNSSQPKAFSFQNQSLDNKENLNNSFKNDYDFFLNTSKDNKNLILTEKLQNISTNPQNLNYKFSKEITELDRLFENKNIILKKLKVTKPNLNAFQEKNDENELFSERIPNQKVIKCSSTIKKHNNYQDRIDMMNLKLNNANISNNNIEINSLFDPIKEPLNDVVDKDRENKDLAFQLKANSKLVDDYRKQIALLEKNFENQKNQQNEINEYRKLINNFEEKINLLIDDNQRLMGVVEIEREELTKFKEASDEMLRHYNEKITNLEKDNKFKDERLQEAILCLDSYKGEIEKLKDLRIMNEKERGRLLEENKRISLRIIESEKNEENARNNIQIMAAKQENFQIEEKDLKSKKEGLEQNLKELLKKNQLLNKDLNERIAELNKVKKEFESYKQEKQTENEKFVIQFEQIRTQSDQYKDLKEKEIKELKNELTYLQEKHVGNEKMIVRHEETIKGLESSLKKLEQDLNEKDRENEKNSAHNKNEYMLLKNHLEEILKQNEILQNEKENITKEYFQLQQKSQELTKANDSLSNNIQQTHHTYQIQFENFKKSTINAKTYEINEVSNNFQKQILEKTRLINEFMTKNKDLLNELENIKHQKDDYKQKLTKMDFNYGKAMQELKLAYDQESKIKIKNFQYQLFEYQRTLSEKEKLINSFAREKEELLIILRRTTEELNKKNVHELQAKTFKKLIEEKSQENDSLKREIVLKNRMRNHSAEREYACDKKPRLSLDYRRSLHLLNENDNLNNEIFQNCMQMY